MTDAYSFMTTVMTGNLLVSLVNAFQLFRHKKKVLEFTTFNKSNLKFFSKIIKEKNSVYEFIYDLHVTLTDFHHVLTSICSLNHTFADQSQIESNHDIGVYLLSLISLVTWLEKKKTSCSAMSAMHIGGFKEHLDELAFFFHTCLNQYLRISLLEQKYITEFYSTSTDTSLISILNSQHIQKLATNVSTLIAEVSKRKKVFLELECVDEFILGCFLETLLEKNTLFLLLPCSYFGTFVVVKNIFKSRETNRLRCRIHSKVKKMFQEKMRTSYRLKDITILFYEEIKEINHNLSDFNKKLDSQFHEELYQIFLHYELPSLCELRDKIKNLTEITETILFNDAVIKEKIHRRVFESQLLA